MSGVRVGRRRNGYSECECGVSQHPVDAGSLPAELFCELACRAVVAGYVHALREKVAYQRAHADAAGAYKIDRMYILSSHYFIVIGQTIQLVSKITNYFLLRNNKSAAFLCYWFI